MSRVALNGNQRYQFFKSSVWRQLRWSAMRSHSFKCEVCSADDRPLVVRYDMPFFGKDQLLSELHVLCPGCGDDFMRPIQERIKKAQG